MNLEELKTWVGKEQQLEDDLHPFRARAMAAALDMEAAPQVGDPLPLGWQWMYFVEIAKASQTGADGHPETGDFLPPAPFPRRMWAAGKARIEAPLIIGQPAQKRSTIASVDFKEGRSGSLFFVTVNHETHQNGSLCMAEEQSLVYRAMPEPLAPGEAAPPLPPGKAAEQAPDWRSSITADPVLLFRFSALTSNSHRIHYDRQYAQQAEHYPALVVHGPLQATLLAKFLAENLPGHRPKTFNFRAQRPLFDTEPFSLCGRQEDDKVELWTESADGYIGMWADVELDANQ